MTDYKRGLLYKGVNSTSAILLPTGLIVVYFGSAKWQHITLPSGECKSKSICQSIIWTLMHILTSKDTAGESSACLVRCTQGNMFLLAKHCDWLPT